MRLYGDEIYRENVDTLYDLGKEFAGMIEAEDHMETAMEPSSNIVCFRYVPEKGDADQINKKIADALLKDGTYYVVSTAVGGKFFLRATFMNPLTDRENMKELIEIVKRAAREQEEA